MTGKVIRDEVRPVRIVVTIGPVVGVSDGTFGWFLDVRARVRERAKDRETYGTCIICRRPFDDDDPIHMVFNVVRNGRPVGNRLSCTACAEVHATHRRSGGDS